jgi:hypothetical protein
VLHLAINAGLPELRQYVLRAHLVLYAHSDSRVLMLSVRPQRELGYAPDTERGALTAEFAGQYLPLRYFSGETVLKRRDFCLRPSISLVLARNPSTR